MARLRDGLALVTCLLCIPAHAQATAPASSAHPDIRWFDIRWCDPIDGLSIGIEVPKGPIRFVGYSDWKGPLQVLRPQSMRYNPGGFWDHATRVTVHLHNVSDTTLYWSRRFTIWTVSLTSPDFPVPDTVWMHHPSPCWRDPIPLAPGAFDSVTLSVGGSSRIWPRIPSGRYQVSVTYRPDEIVRNSRGGELPYDIPGFVAKPVRTPTIDIEIDASPNDTHLFDFATGPHGWMPAFCDYPVGEEDAHELLAGSSRLPDPLDQSRRALVISGNNVGEDLFMYYRRKIGGLEPGRDYLISFTLEIAADAPSGCIDACGKYPGGPALLAGASQEEPEPIKVEGWHRFPLEKGRPAWDEQTVALLGQASAGHMDCSDNAPYEIRRFRTGIRRVKATASPTGELWLFFGTDSRVPETTKLYYTRLTLGLTPT